MHHFRFLQDELYCEDLPLQKIANEIETPFYLYSKNTILDNFEETTQAFQNIDHLICYALKANSNTALMSLLAQQGAGADVVSGGEIHLALKSGFPPEKIVYAGVGKTEKEIKYALEQGILSFNSESLEEIEAINEIASGLHKKAPIGIRINPHIDIHGHPYISTGKAENKFGIDIPEVERILHEIRSFSNIELIGLHCHIGSQITQIESFLNAARSLNELRKEIKAQGIDLKYIDIGGGLGVRYENVFHDHIHNNELSENGLTVRALVKHMHRLLRELDSKIIFEPGRSLVAESGVLVTKVLFNKKTYGKRFVIVDAGMTDLIRPSLYDAYHDIVPVKKTSRKMVEVDVVGPICESGDFLAKSRMLPEVKRGDLLAVMTVGAYGYSLSSNYNARPRPAEVLVDGKNYRVIRERGKLEDLWK